MKSKVAKNIALALSSLLIAFTIFGKLARSPQVVEQMGPLGLEEELYLLTAIEIVALALYIFPQTINIGFFLLTAYYGGAIAVNLNEPVNTVPAIVFLILIWIATFIRKPALFTAGRSNGTSA